MKSNRFTGDPPYVGWKGLGLALREDYDELAALRARVETLEGALEPFASAAAAYDPDDGDSISEAWATKFYVGELRRARAALGDTHE